MKTARTERFLRPLRALGALSRFGVILALLAIITLVGVGVGVTGLLRAVGVFTLQRTTNQIGRPPAAANHGSLLAETGKLVTVTGSNGQAWQVAEVIVANQHDGQVTRSLPASSVGLRQASAGSLPVGVVSDGRMVYELTSAQNNGLQALVGFDIATGATRIAAVVVLPNGDALPPGVSAISLTLAPGGATAYIGLGATNGALSGVRALAVSTRNGQIVKALTVTTPDQIPLPPPPGSLPASAFPGVIPIVSLQGMRQTLASGGALAVSPDGQAVFDSVLARDNSGVRYAIVRRLDLTTGGVTALGLPGDFSATQLVASASTSAPDVYLVTGSPQATVYVLDTSAQGPTLSGQVALGGPVTSASERLRDTLTVSRGANGVWLYVTQDAATSDGVVAAHSRWLVDTEGMGLVASVTDPSSAGALLGNNASGGKTFALINGQIEIGAPDLSTGWTPWLQPSDNTPIVQLITTTP